MAEGIDTAITYRYWDNLHSGAYWNLGASFQNGASKHRHCER